MTQPLTLDVVKQAVAGTAAAFRRVVELQPAGGQGDKVFPATYKSGKYAFEKRRIDVEIVDCVLLDSVQSQANRMELALLEAWRRKAITLPMIVVDFSQTEAVGVGQITSLEAPHRIADAILRDSLLGGQRFRNSEIGKRLNQVSNRNALALFELCPPALIFGMWDSTGPRGGLGAKFARAMTSEIVGIGAVMGVKTSSRIDPLQIIKSAGPVYKLEDGDWTLDAQKVKTGKKNAPAESRPSEVNHGNIPPTLADGGVTLQKALQTTVFSLPAVRRLYFGQTNDHAARVVLTALGLCAATLASEQGYDLRSRCQLVATTPLTWELLDKPGESPISFALSGNQAIDVLNAAIAEARTAGLPWAETPVTLTPKDDLAKLVKKSYELAASAGEGDE